MCRLVFVVVSVACLAACATTPSWGRDVHRVTVDGHPGMTRAEVVEGWHARASAVCHGQAYEVISTLVDRGSNAYREGGRLDRNGRVMRVPAVEVHAGYAVGIVHCGQPAAAPREPTTPKPSTDACNDGEAAACIRVAKARHAAGDEPRALTWLGKACRLGDATACVDVGRALEARDAVDRDLELAAQFYKQGCKLGADAACEAFARARARACVGLRGEGP